MHQFQDLRNHELVFVLEGCWDLILYFFAVHFGEAEIAQNTSQIFPIDSSSFLGVVEVKGILDLIFLHKVNDYHIFWQLAMYHGLLALANVLLALLHQLYNLCLIWVNVR